MLTKFIGAMAETYESMQPDPDALKRKRNHYNKEQKAAKKEPARIKARAKQKAARNARKKNR